MASRFLSPLCALVCKGRGQISSMQAKVFTQMHEAPCHTNQRQGEARRDTGRGPGHCGQRFWHRTFKDPKFKPGLPRIYEGVFGKTEAWDIFSVNEKF